MVFKVAGEYDSTDITASVDAAADVSLAAFGRKEIEIAEVGHITPAPILMI